MIKIDHADNVAKYLGIRENCFGYFINHLRAVCLVKDSVADFTSDANVINVVKQLVSDIKFKLWFSEPPRLVYLDQEEWSIVFVMNEYAYYLNLEDIDVEVLNASFNEASYHSFITEKPGSYIKKPF